MRRTWCIRNLAAALASVALTASATAQTAVILKSVCQDVGVAAREPVGDRDGHAIQAAQYSCRNEGGATDGSLMTGSVLWEWDKATSTLLVGSGVLRRPGALAVFENTEGKASLTLVDGRVTGIVGTSKGSYRYASGGMAALAVKSFTATFHSVGSGQFVIETTLE
jgi:hypothetical protein